MESLMGDFFFLFLQLCLYELGARTNGQKPSAMAIWKCPGGQSVSDSEVWEVWFKELFKKYYFCHNFRLILKFSKKFQEYK